MSRIRNALLSVVLLGISLAIGLVAAEGFLRVKNSAMTNYDIEMWRYANELKQKSYDPAVDFDHLRSKTATLQNIQIRLNSWGLRGP